jgi:type IX secretion system PorP/SprF family membrane protein
MQIKYFIMVGLVAVSLQANAQGQGYVDIGQKWLNRPFLNPAATGNTPFLETNLFVRQQWMGVEGAPSTQHLFGHCAIPNFNAGVGVAFTNEYIGLFHTFNIKLAYAYHVPLGQGTAISFGLAGNAMWMFRDDSKIELQNPNIGTRIPPIKSSMFPNFDAGVELHNKWLKIGLSAMHLIDAPKDYSNPALVDYINPDIDRTFYAYASCRVGAGTGFAISPSLLGSVSHGFYDGEVGALFFHKRLRQKNGLVRLSTRYSDTYDFLWAGAFLRFSGTMAVMAGISITEQWRLGYAYEYTFRFQNIKHVATHEVMLWWYLPGFQRGPRKYLCDDC